MNSPQQSQPPQMAGSRDMALQCMSAIQVIQSCVLQLTQKDLGSEALISQLKNQITQLQKDIQTLQSQLQEDKDKVKTRNTTQK